MVGLGYVTHGPLADKLPLALVQSSYLVFTSGSIDLIIVIYSIIEIPN